MSRFPYPDFCWSVKLGLACATSNIVVGINSSPSKKMAAILPDDSFEYIFLNENLWIPTEISSKFVSKGPVSDILALFRMMAWRRTGDKSLSELMLTYVGDVYIKRLLASMSWQENGHDPSVCHIWSPVREARPTMLPSCVVMVREWWGKG